MSPANRDSQQESPKRILPTAAIARMEEDIEGLRALTMEQRGRMIEAACQAAARLERSKIQSGLPPSVPDPWPESTWQFLKEHAPNAKQSPTD